MGLQPVSKREDYPRESCAQKEAYSVDSTQPMLMLQYVVAPPLCDNEKLKTG